MPTFLVPVFEYIGGALITAGAVEGGILIIGAASYLATAAALLGTLALSQYQKRKAERAARAQFDAAQVDRFANMPLTVAPRELVVGRLVKGGTPFFRSSWGPFKDTFVMTIALASHEIDGVEGILFNGAIVNVDGSGNVTSAPYARTARMSTVERMTSTSVVLLHTPVPESIRVVKSQIVDGGSGVPDALFYRQLESQDTVPFTLSGNTVTITDFDSSSDVQYLVPYQWEQVTTFARVFWHLGAPGQASDARLQAYFPGVWTVDHKATGVAYLLCEFVYDETAFPSGIPNVTAQIRGAKIYDPRNGLTQFTENPALMMRHVLLHPQFGKRSSITATEDARIIAAANACDTAFSYTGSDLVQMYRAASVFPYGSAARDALDDLAQAMGGEWAYASGEFYARAGVYQAPVASLTDADLAVVQRDAGGSVSQSAITISPHRARNEKINTVVARIWDQAAGYVQTPIMPMRVDAYVAADGAEISQEVTMPAVFYAYQAFHIAGIMLRDSRDPLTVVLPFKMTAYPIELFDTVNLTLARYGWATKTFRVLGRTFMPGGYVVLTLKETAAAIYQWGAGFLPNGYAANSGLPRPWDISPPTITGIFSGEGELIVQSDGTVINGVRVTWGAIQDQSIANGGFVEVGYLLPPYDTWRTISVPGADTQVVIPVTQDGTVMGFNVRSRNSVAVSNWGVQVWHQVTGKSDPPPDIEELSIAGSVLSWTMPRRPADLAGFIFRFHYGSNLDWNSATPLHEGIITESPWEPKNRPAGVVTIMGKAIDTTGNESLATANIVMNLGDAPIANVVEQWDFNALGWPNSAADSTGWTIVSGKPTASALDSFYGTDDQSFYGTAASPFYDASAYGQMVYVTNQIAVSSALAGSVMTLVTQAQGTDLRVEYRLAGPTAFYGPDGASFYGITGSDPFYEAPGSWLPWPGQIVADRDVYQFRVTIGAGPTQGILQSLVLTIDAPDLSETLANIAISSTGTAVPYTKAFANIKVVQAQLQTNGSGAVTVEIDKTVPLAPVIRAFNSSHVAVSGATVDILIQGY
jgi:hypothetical protein